MLLLIFLNKTLNFLESVLYCGLKYGGYNTHTVILGGLSVLYTNNTPYQPQLVSQVSGSIC